MVSVTWAEPPPLDGVGHRQRGVVEVGVRRSSLASAIGGAILAAKTIDLAGHALPSLGAYRLLFAICAAAAVAAALIALVIPRHAATSDAALPE